MSVEVIGNRIIKALPNGKTVISETNGNITLTKVLDRQGKEIINRAKKIEKQKVGDKDVFTRTDVKKVTVFNNDPSKSTVIGFKNILDRVYKDGKFLGARLTEYMPESNSVLSQLNPLKYINDGPKYVTKASAKEFFGYTKQFGSNGKVFHKRCNTEGCVSGKIKPQYRSEYKAEHSEIGIGERDEKLDDFYGNLKTRTHNSKGLPMPSKMEKYNESILDYEKMDKMSLKEMRQEWYDKTGGTTSYSRGMNLDKLNDVKDITIPIAKDTSIPINDLEQYL